MRCENCAFWDGRNKLPNGYSTCRKLSDVYICEKQDEAGGAWGSPGSDIEEIVTGKDFGCIYFTSKEATQ